MGNMYSKERERYNRIELKVYISQYKITFTCEILINH